MSDNDSKVMCIGSMEDLITRIDAVISVLKLIHGSLKEADAAALHASALYSAIGSLELIEENFVNDVDMSLDVNEAKVKEAMGLKEERA